MGVVVTIVARVAMTAKTVKCMSVVDFWVETDISLTEG